MVWVVSLSTAKLIPRGLTPEIVVIGIRSLVRWGTPGRAPIRFSLSTPDDIVARGYP